MKMTSLFDDVRIPLHSIIVSMRIVKFRISKILIIHEKHLKYNFVYPGISEYPDLNRGFPPEMRIYQPAKVLLHPFYDDVRVSQDFALVLKLYISLAILTIYFGWPYH